MKLITELQQLTNKGINALRAGLASLAAALGVSFYNRNKGKNVKYIGLSIVLLLSGCAIVQENQGSNDDNGRKNSMKTVNKEAIPESSEVSTMDSTLEVVVAPPPVQKKQYDHLRIIAESTEDNYKLTIWIESGFASFNAVIPLTKEDYLVIENDAERASFLQAALHEPFQLKKNNLNLKEQRQYLDIILHASKSTVEAFLTDKDHGKANGAISNMMRITSGRDQSLLRSGKWFAQ